MIFHHALVAKHNNLALMNLIIKAKHKFLTTDAAFRHKITKES